MTIRSRIFIGIFLLLGAGFYFLIDFVVDELKPRYRESTEEPIVDTAYLLAALAAASVKESAEVTNSEPATSREPVSDRPPTTDPQPVTGPVIDIQLFRTGFEQVQAQRFTARIYGLVKNNVDLRVYITDRQGKVLFDSDQGLDEGKDYSQWRDVLLTLRGEYGARATPSRLDPDVSMLYIAAPIIHRDETIGVLTVGKPTTNAIRFMSAAREKLVIGGTVICLLLIIIGLAVTVMITRPIQRLTSYARAVRDGKRVRLPRLGGGEMAELGAAFEEMRDALEGRRYVEYYVQTMTHEIKSPLAAIHGAVELLDESMPVEQRRRFLHNIERESERIGTIVERLLLLASLESRKVIDQSHVVALTPLLEDVKISLTPQMEANAIQLTIEGETGCQVKGEEGLIRQALLNIIQNAIEFSPSGGAIAVTVIQNRASVTARVRDHGCGIPDYAQTRIFERFYSLQRPGSGKKSSGLGLTLVREIMTLHGGTVSLESHPDGGAVAELVFKVKG